MEPVATTPVDIFTFYLVLGVALVIIPATLTWWAIAQRVNYMRQKAGIQQSVGFWHALRFGPVAPLLTLLAFVGGIVRFDLSSFPIDAIALTVCGLLAFMMSIVLWAYASNPNESADSGWQREGRR